MSNPLLTVDLKDLPEDELVLGKLGKLGLSKLDLQILPYTMRYTIHIQPQFLCQCFLTHN